AMTIQRVAALVSSGWLRKSLLQASRPVLLDTSWVPEPHIDGHKEFYSKGHISGALYFDLKKISSKRPDSPIDCPVPDPRTFRDYAQELGIRNGSHVVVYDSLNSRSSVRSWYLFRLFGHDNVSMLNGGMKQWQREGNDVTRDPSEAPERSDFEVRFRDDLLVDFKGMEDIVKNKRAQIVDTRPKSGGFYPTAEDKSGGHMPGAKSIPFTDFFNEDGTFKADPDLKQMMISAGIDMTKPTVATCQRGMTACAMVMAAFNLGNEKLPVYNGSWLEWSVLADPNHVIREPQRMQT
ncbi:thiosulfate sulfurtransferase, partial [Biomphalaria glabrata]